MAITHVGSAGNAQINGGNTIIDVSGLSLQEDDIVYVFSIVASTTSDNPSMSASGYTTLVNNLTSDGSTNRVTFYVARKVQTSSPDSSITVTLTNGTVDMGHASVAMAYRGGSTTTPEDATTTTQTGNNSDPDSPSITTNTDGAFVISCAGIRVRDSTDIVQPSGYGNAFVITQGTNETHNSSIGAADIEVSTAAAEDPAAWGGWANAVGRPWFAVSVAVQPSGATSSLVILRRRREE